MTRLMKQPHQKWRGRIQRYDLLLFLAAFSLVAGVLPDAFYVRLLAKLPINISVERATTMVQQLRLYAPLLTAAVLAVWWMARRWAADVQAGLNLKSKLVGGLLQLHFLVFIPTVAYWIFYGVYWLSIPEVRQREESRVVPWHNDLSDAVARLRWQIPENAAVLLILEDPAPASYTGYFNTYLYSRKVYIYRRELGENRMRRADVNFEALRKLGIDWIVTYSGPQEFQADQLKLERIH